MNFLMNFVKLLCVSLCVHVSLWPAFAAENKQKTVEEIVNNYKPGKKLSVLFKSIRPYLREQAQADLDGYIKKHGNLGAPKMTYKNNKFIVEENSHKLEIELITEKNEPFIKINSDLIPLREISDVGDLIYQFEKRLKTSKQTKYLGLPSLLIAPAHAFDQWGMVMGALLGTAAMGAFSNWDTNKMILGAIGGGLIGWFGSQQGWWNKKTTPAQGQQ